MIQDSKGFTFSKAEFSALVAHAGRDATRANIYGIAIEPMGTVFATDGHRLLRGRMAESSERKSLDIAEPVILPVDACKAVVKAAKAKDTIRVDVDRDGVTATVGAATVRIAYAKRVSPPPIDQIIPSIPRGTACAALCIDASFFSDLAPLAASFRACGIILANTGSELDPAVVAFEGSPEWIAVLMPRRCNAAWSVDADAPRSGIRAA